MTIQDLADELNTRRETIRHGLSYMEKMRLVRICGHRNTYKANGVKALTWGLHPRLKG